MRSHSTREFLAGVAIAQQFGRPGTPTDQAWIETLFGYVKSEWPHLEKIRDPAELDAELAIAQSDYNGIRLHAGLQNVTPNGEHEGRGDASGSNAATDLLKHATTASHTVETATVHNQEKTDEHTATPAGYIHRQVAPNSNTPQSPAVVT